MKDLRSGEQTAVAQDSVAAHCARYWVKEGEGQRGNLRERNDQVEAVKRFFAENGKALAVG